MLNYGTLFICEDAVPDNYRNCTDMEAVGDQHLIYYVYAYQCSKCLKIKKRRV